MAKITVFTATNCPKCPAAKKVCEEVAKQTGAEFKVMNIEEEDNMIVALQNQIASTPSIMVNGTVEFRGEVPSKAELIKLLG